MATYESITEELSSKQQSLSWSDAITLIKNHKRVSRKAYDKKDNYIFEKFINLSPDGKGFFILICVPNYIHIINGIYSGKVYIPTKEDMAANDWYEVTDDDIAVINRCHHPFSNTIDADGDILLF